MNKMQQTKANKLSYSSYLNFLQGTWECAAHKGILFRTSSLAKGVLFSNFSQVKSRQGYAFW